MTTGRKSQVACSSPSISLHVPDSTDSYEMPVGVTTRLQQLLLIESKREWAGEREDVPRDTNDG